MEEIMKKPVIKGICLISALCLMLTGCQTTQTTTEDVSTQITEESTTVVTTETAEVGTEVETEETTKTAEAERSERTSSGH